MGLIGIKNRTKDTRSVQFDSRVVVIKPEEIVLLEDAMAAHANEQMVYLHGKDKDGNIIQNDIKALKLFELVPLDEAVKLGAKLPESAFAVAEREKKAKELQERKKLVDEIKLQVRAEIEAELATKKK